MEKLGSGSYGDVYRNDKEEAALKFFSTGNVGVFLRELSIGIHLSAWKGFVKIKSFNIPNRMIKMDLWPCDLSVIIRSGNGTHKERLKICTDIIRSVYIMHKLGIVHADIKPSNIMIRESNGEVESSLIDYGLSGFPGYADTYLTSAYYKEPKQESDFPHDIYSIGVILLEMFADVVFVKRPNYKSLYNMTKRIKDKKISDLARMMLIKDKKSRITAEGALLFLNVDIPVVIIENKNVVNELAPVHNISWPTDSFRLNRINVCLSDFPVDDMLSIASTVLLYSIYHAKCRPDVINNEEVVKHLNVIISEGFPSCFLSLIEVDD